MGKPIAASPYLENWVFDCKAAKEAFVRKLIIDQDALCEFRKPGWQLLLATLFPPYFHLPGRIQFTRDCLSMHDKLKNELIDVKIPETRGWGIEAGEEIPQTGEEEDADCESEEEDETEGEEEEKSENEFEDFTLP